MGICLFYTSVSNIMGLYMNKIILATCVTLNMASVCYASAGGAEPETQPAKLLDTGCFGMADPGEPVLERQNAVANLASQQSLVSTVLVDQYSESSSGLVSHRGQRVPAEGTKENPIDVG